MLLVKEHNRIGPAVFALLAHPLKEGIHRRFKSHAPVKGVTARCRSTHDGTARQKSQRTKKLSVDARRLRFGEVMLSFEKVAATRGEFHAVQFSFERDR